jgi:hypothetical protein
MLSGSRYLDLDLTSQMCAPGTTLVFRWANRPFSCSSIPRARRSNIECGFRGVGNVAPHSLDAGCASASSASPGVDRASPTASPCDGHSPIFVQHARCEATMMAPLVRFTLGAHAVEDMNGIARDRPGCCALRHQHHASCRSSCVDCSDQRHSCPLAVPTRLMRRPQRLSNISGCLFGTAVRRFAAYKGPCIGDRVRICSFTFVLRRSRVFPWWNVCSKSSSCERTCPDAMFQFLVSSLPPSGLHLF